MSSQNFVSVDIPPSPDLTCTCSLLVYDWFRSQFPAWEQGLNQRQAVCSQSLMAATIPESPHGPKGIVHFKSILDPLWAPGDMASLRAGFPWVLLVLSPFERFYELDPALDELSAGTTQLAIWRPDRPTVEESARLRVSSLVNASRQSEPVPEERGAAHADKSTRQLLTALYAQRGSLIVQGRRHLIRGEIGDLSLAQYVAACLVCLSSSVTVNSESPPRETEQLALRWSALLCRSEDQPEASLYTAKSRALDWAGKHVDGALGIFRAHSHFMPESFLTTRFREEAKSFDTALERIQYIFRCLRRGEIAFAPAMAQLAQVFNSDEARLLRWRDMAEDLPGFVAWLPTFASSRRYLGASFRTTDVDLENLKDGLLAVCDDPNRFLRTREREFFDENFGKFKAAYVEYYGNAHEETVSLVGNQEKMKSKVDYVALRNLELLADLDLADKGHLNHARAIGKFMQANQCRLPVREILSRQPHCYCNYNPAPNLLLAKSIGQMNKAIQEGTEQIRSLLRKSRLAIIQELEITAGDDQHTKQIAALLSRGPMVPLTRPAVDLLNSILRKCADAPSDIIPTLVTERLAEANETSDYYAVTE